jgi:PAS domain S-box-containing protein
LRSTTVTPTGVERTFADDEIIVSKTDPRGRLTYVNDVFVRVSGYEERDLIGMPHSIIRHPEMPRCVFKLLWDTIATGKELFAYVVNLSADGAHYWVLAHVTPTFGPGREIVGYHSNRRTAAPAAVARVEELYAGLLAEERRHGDPVAAVAASTELLHRTLADVGQTYDEFVWALTSASEEAA